jgi:hypothetical protein
MATINYDAISAGKKGALADFDENEYRLSQIESEKKAALTENEQLYDGMINSSDSYYNAQIDAAKQWGDTQAKNQQEQTDFAIEQIEQQKDQLHKDYLKEQSGAYVDWQKQSNNYGSNAEKMAANGLAHTGFSESSQVAMYNQYQNRVATSRATYTQAKLNYDNAIKDARLKNNSILAEIAYQTLQTSLSLALEGFQYKNQLVLAKADRKAQIGDRYWGRFQDTLSQINTEKSLAESIRQYNESMAFEREKFKEEQRQFNETMAFNKAKSFNSGGGGSRRSSSGSSSVSSQTVKKSTLTEREKALYQQIGMNRTTEGRVETIQRLADRGAISEAEAQKLLDKYTD